MSVIDPFVSSIVSSSFNSIGRSTARCDLRRLEYRYLARKQQVKQFWVFAGVGVLCFPTLHVAVSVGLFTTFLSFMYLDESE